MNSRSKLVAGAFLVAWSLAGCGGTGSGKLADGSARDGHSAGDRPGTAGSDGVVDSGAAGTADGGAADRAVDFPSAGAADGAAVDGDAADLCESGFVACGGACVPVYADPKNCGGCGKACQSDEVCLGSTCAPASSCPRPLQACAGTCVDTGSSNDHCGSCGNKCPTGQGCQSGRCVPSVPVGPSPAKCANGGPPIIFTDTPVVSCGGNQASSTFKFALCSCSDIGVPVLLSSDFMADGFDSGKGPYSPGGLGASVGANGGVNMSSKFTVFGDLQSAGAAGVTVGAETTVHENLQVQSDLKVNAQLTVDGDAYVSGAITGIRDGSIAGTLLTPSCAAVPAHLQRKACANAAITVPPPCPCQPNDLIPIASRITQYADPGRNDNAAIGLKADVLDGPGAPTQLDLPCGYYYLNQIDASDPMTIAVHGHTALFVAGSIEVSSTLIFTLDTGATLDVYVGGTIYVTGTLNVGSPAYPARSRFYVGGVSLASGTSCKLRGECSSLNCSRGTCVAGGTDRPFSVNLTSPTQLNGLFYAPNGGFVTSSNLEMYGAVFVGYYQSSSPTAIHYDRATTTIGFEECPPVLNPPPDGGVPLPGADAGTLPGCTPRDDDNDGYYACDCWAPTMSCALSDSSPACAADCCDRPGDPGCPTGLDSLSAAAAINPGRVDLSCDGIDNNCATETLDGAVTARVCSAGTGVCFVQ